MSRFVPLYINDESRTRHDNYNIHTNNTTVIVKEFIEKYNLILSANSENIFVDLFNLSEEIYNNNISAFEILHKFKKHKNYNNVFMVFEKFRMNVRNEIFCIFFILCVFRNNHKLEIFDLY